MIFLSYFLFLFCIGFLGYASRSESKPLMVSAILNVVLAMFFVALATLIDGEKALINECEKGLSDGKRCEIEKIAVPKVD